MTGIPVASMSAHRAAAVAADVHANWRKYAACAGRADVMEYYPGTALALCEHCPVQQECQAWVLALPESADPGGICGGTSEPERTSYRRRLAFLRKQKTRELEAAHG